jgi:hypothetical protein
MGRVLRPVVAWMASPAVIGPICWRCRDAVVLPAAEVMIGNR